ncbi:RND transporter [Burkholderia ubonensis]|uniref:efflux transporter outer membrane subunit n=1 Tax=Burkholderia ubonensis TaxID=101571 RepID=UPI00075C8269|nr:efflux transporter outer membrane subunit [Burkholderia ubonensis]KVG85727.1 RND transporter [Burkholderia ubonensis]
MRRGMTVLLLAVLPMLHACMVGPDYVRPKVDTPAAFKELAGWKVAEPMDHVSRSRWWERFGDPQLDALEEQVEISNLNIRVAEAQYREAQALARASRASYFPLVTGDLSVTRSQSPSKAAGSAKPPVTNHTLSVDAAWEPDVWGRVGRLVESREAGAQASAADLEVVRLSMRAALAQNYFLLVTADAQKELLDRTVAAYARSLQFVRNQYGAGVATKADVAQAETQLKTVQAAAIDVGVQRAQLEHAIALLVGKAPADLAVERVPLLASPPRIPLEVPSSLLERRPDIAGAERRVAAANAQIGVARAAWFPAIILSASGGFDSASFAHWFTVPNRMWSLGAAIAETIFDGGLRHAQSDQALAAYDATVANYRQTVLAAFQEVEDNLAALRILEQEAQVQDGAVKAAQESVVLTTNQYRAGTVSFLNVVITQTTALANERAAVDIQGRRLAASVNLIKALGGGWSDAM